MLDEKVLDELNPTAEEIRMIQGIAEFSKEEEENIEEEYKWWQQYEKRIRKV